MRHHTKDKGDKGLAFVIADLLKNNVQVGLLISEHLPFDCIAISENNQLCKLSVKYRKVKDNLVSVALKSIWSDKNGVHIKKHDKQTYDAIAIYCPDTNECYYIRVDEVNQTVNLRMNTSPYKMSRIKYAKDYTDPKRLFMPP